MGRVLTTLILILAALAVVGLYRGWFHVDSDNSGSNPSMTVTVDKDKIRHDNDKINDSLGDAAHQVSHDLLHPTTQQ